MKRILSAILAAIMLFSMLPLSLFAGDAVEEAVVPESAEMLEPETATIAEEENYMDFSAFAEDYGTVVTVGDEVYGIEDGVLLHAVGNAKAETVCENVTFVIERDGKVYYAVLNGFNTYIYAVGEETEIAKIFAPIDCFDIEDAYVYYSYNGEVMKLDTATGEETSLYAGDTTLFYVEDGAVQAIAAAAVEEEAEEDLSLTALTGYVGEDFTTNPVIAKKLNELFNLLPYGEYPYFTMQGDSSSNCASGFACACNNCNSYYVCRNHPILKKLGVTIEPKTTYTCYGFVYWAYKYLYGDEPGGWNYSGTYHSKMLRVDRIVSGEYSTERMRELASKAYAGDVLQTCKSGGSSGHTMIFLGYDDSGIYVLNNNWEAASRVTISYIKYETFKTKYPYAMTIFRSPNYPPSCSSCITAGTKAYKEIYTGEGVCPKCKSVYDWKSTRTTDLDKVTVGTYTENGTKKYKKLYLRKSPYDVSDNLIVSKKFKSVEVLALVYNADGGRWYEVNADGKHGYIVAYKVDSDYTKQSDYGVSEITISPKAYPTGTIQPKSFNLTGTISSKYPLYKVVGEVVDANSGKTVLGPETVYPKETSSISIQSSAINQNLRFSSLKNGTYYLKYTVWDVTDNDASKGNIETWKSPNFAVAKAVPNKENCTPPSFAVSNIVNGQRVTVTCSKSNELIHVSTPWGEKTGYNSVAFDITTGGSYSISAWTTGSGKIDSLKASTTVSVATVPQPTITDPQYVASCVYVELIGNGDIYYTLDGSTPTSGSKKYSGPILLEKSTTIRAIAMQYGHATSAVSSYNAVVSVPDAPTVTMSNANKIAQGESVFASWNGVSRATSYTAYLLCDGTVVRTVDTADTNATFVLDKYSDIENYTYTVYVVAHNSLGDSAQSNTLTVMAMHPLTVKFVDRILREDGVTDAVVAQIQENVTAHFNDDRKIEGNVLSVQRVAYGKKASIPSWEDKDGFSRQYFSGEAYQAITTDTEAHAYYSVESYSVQFYDTAKKQQLGGTEKLFYSYGVTYPTDVELPIGYILAGWNVDAKISNCFTPDFVDGNIKLNTVFTWENKDLPVVLEIVSAKRANTCRSYEVNLKYTNNNILETFARVIVTLYTADGKAVYTQTKDVDLREQKVGYYYTDTVTLDYPEKVSKISAVLVQVKNDMTGGAVSEMKYTTDIELPNAETYWDKWSEWSETVPDTEPGEKDGVDALNREIEEDVWYRYRNKEYTESSASSLSGWESNGKYVSNWSGEYGPVYYNPENGERSVRSEKYVKSSNYKTVYRYYRYSTSLCGYWGSSRYGDYPYYYEFEYDQPLQLKPGDNVSYYKWCDCGIEGGYHTVYSVNWREHGDYPAQVWVSDNYETRWYYRDPIYTYKYWRWSDWSAWSTENKGGDEVHSINVYRYRDEFSMYDGYDPSKDTSLEEPTKKTYPIAGNVPGLEEDYSGKLATVLVYKKTNTDPTQEQLEYVDQITLGTDNSYSFVVNPKHEIDYVDTGDYIVTLSIEGCDKLVNVDVIKAPVPTRTVTFQNADGTVLTDADGKEVIVSVEIGGAVDVNAIPVPQKEGHTFVKWDKTLINIDENMTVSPVFKKNIYSVVFVDHENETVELVEMEYGDYCELPTVAAVPGKTFVGWAEGDKPVAAGDVVTGSKIITAVWETNQYRVVFCDFDDNVIDDQTVEYGQSAVPPALVEKDGVVYAWDITSDAWWNVTYDMIIYPFVPDTSDVAAPMIDASTEDVGGTFYANLSSAEEEGTIYYSYYQNITADMAKQVVELKKNQKEEGESEGTVSLLDIALEEEEGLEEGYNPQAGIFEYTEAIQVTEGSIIYAFTANANGEISPISVFEFGCSDVEYTGETGDIYARDPSVPVIQMQNASVIPGETVEVPVTITNNPGMTELALVFGYDNNNLKLISAENGSVFADAAFSADIREDGSCKFSWNAETAATEDGTLAILTFLAGANAGESTVTIYVDADMEEDDDYPAVATEHGTLSKKQDVLATGDTNGDGDVDFSDALLILKHDVGLSTLTASQIACSDVNGDGEADFSDAILILKYDVGLIDKIGQ